MSATSVAANLNKILMLNGTNFKDWKENITILLGCMDLDLALREPKPDVITGTSSESGQAYKGTWERSNRLSLMIIRRGIPEVFRGIVPHEISSAKDYLAEFEKRFVENDKAKTSELLANLISMKYSGKEYSQFMISYNCQREKWTLDKAISFCVEEEEMLKHAEAANSKAPVLCGETGHVKKKCPM
ncbi:hypothetical protein QQ045_020601 [Rhodiola kirilowii]